MNGQGSVIWLDNGIRNLWRRHNGESSHHSVGEFLSDSRDQQSTHTGTGTTTQRVGDLETLQGVTAFGLSSNDIHNRVDQLGTLSVVTLGPHVASRRLAKDVVIRTEQVTNTGQLHSVDSTWFQIHENSTRNVFARRGLVKVNIQLGLLDAIVAMIITIVV